MDMENLIDEEKSSQSYNYKTQVNNCENDCEEESLYPDYDFHVTLSIEEKIKCLEEIINKLNKILYVYDKSLEPESQYNYKVYCGGILIYVSSSNNLFDGELVNIIVNINAIITNDFEKSQLKRVVFESKNFAKFLLDKYKEDSPQVIEQSVDKVNKAGKYGTYYKKAYKTYNRFDYRKSDSSYKRNNGNIENTGE